MSYGYKVNEVRPVRTDEDNQDNSPKVISGGQAAPLGKQHGAKFQLGNTYATAGIVGALNHDEVFGVWVGICVLKHALGEWGDLCENDKQANEYDLTHGGRILSCYKIPAEGLECFRLTGYDLPDEKIYVITEADRSQTTIMFPSEY